MRVKPIRTATARAMLLVGVCGMASTAVLVGAARIRQAHGNTAFTQSSPQGPDDNTIEARRANDQPTLDYAGANERALRHAGVNDNTVETRRANDQPTLDYAGVNGDTVEARPTSEPSARDCDDTGARSIFEPSSVLDAAGARDDAMVRSIFGRSFAAKAIDLSSDPYAKLPEVTFFDRNHKQSLRTRLYARGGVIDEDAARRLDLHLADRRDPKSPKVERIDRRLLQLLFRTAYHFEVEQIEVVSAYRARGSGRRREGLHGLARAIDFAVSGVKAEVVASYLRQQARVGVGIYTHRRTRFVHLDVRDQSYHWLDASPPRRTWRGVSIGDKTLPQRDAAYDPRNDWPEGFPTPTDCQER